MTSYDEITARVMVQSIMLDILDLNIRKRQKDRVSSFLKAIIPDPVRYLEMQKNRFSYERPHFAGAKQDEEIS